MYDEFVNYIPAISIMDNNSPNAITLEEAGKTDIIVLDKTGTITKGEPNVCDVIPFDITDDLDIDKICHKRLKGTFKFKYDNGKRIKQWRKILGDSTPTHNYQPEEMKIILAKIQYKDIELNRIIHAGERVEMREARARRIVELGYGEIIE